MLAWFSLRPSAAEIVWFLAGWLAGWIVFWRARPLPPAGGVEPRWAAAVVMPARNEEGSIGQLVGALRRRPGDEVVVVDDHSTDDTARLAVDAGARVVASPPLPEGWLGKPNACRAGVTATVAPVLVFLDADVTPPTDLLDRVVPLVMARPDALLSVQPWHEPGRAVEHLSLPFNVVALMGSAGFTVGARSRWRGARPLAFGPVLACTRVAYESVGGHGQPSVRQAVAEDVALGRLFPSVELYTGRPQVTFRMFPDGLRHVIDGWTKHFAVGALRARWWVLVLTSGWLWSQAGGWLVSPWCWAAATAQLAVFARRAGRFSWVAVTAGPLLMVVFVAVFLRSLALAATRRTVAWKDRPVTPR